MAGSEQTGPEARYGLLLATLVAAYLVSAVTHSRWAGAVHVAFVLAVALLAVRHARLGRRNTAVAVGVGLVTALAAGFCATSARATAEGIANVWNGLTLLLTVAVIIDRVVRLERVTVQSIYGALSGYLLVGLMFASFFGALEYLAPGPFFADGQPANSETLQYFSFTTLTTLGYGDFTAAGNLGRAVAVLEALAGQVFLATLVARLVSAYAGRVSPRGDDPSRRPRHKGERRPPPGE